MKLGFQGRVYYLTTGTRATWGATVTNGFHVAAAPASLAIVGGVKDCSIEAEKNRVDASSRDTGGVEVAMGALTKVPISFKMIWTPTDAGQIAMLTAFLAFGNPGATIAMAILDGDKATAGSTGWWADWCVLKMGEGQALQEGQIVDVTVEPGVSAVNLERVQTA